MIIKTVQWNIGGGLVANVESDRSNDLSYFTDGLQYIIDILKNINPDIVTLQEVHDGVTNQAKVIAEGLGMKFWVLDHYDKSHLDENMWLSQAIISKYPISSHNFGFFPNPNVDVRFANNTKVSKSHNKGMTSASIDIDSIPLSVKTLHMIPFRRTGLLPSDEAFKEQNNDINNKIATSDERVLIQADFNYDCESLSGFIAAIQDENIKEVIQSKPTTPEGQRYDHVLYRGIRLISTDVNSDVLTDHLPIISEFEIIN